MSRRSLDTWSGRWDGKLKEDVVFVGRWSLDSSWSSSGIWSVRGWCCELGRKSVVLIDGQEGWC